ncbi:hypothetical protein HB852_01225 [Listeria grandensis]|uniref:hypothetical protein n=1 Tax=Listeria grandensis TaxID=1494963 RepID=UPI0016263839|nr:hypothetical protein [Listeria grandensis]MBC1473238.1 hypothetical protein [Listeria grandensis]
MMKCLAIALSVHKSDITAKVNRLLEKDSIHRAKNPQDLRGFRLTITKNGEKVYET